MKKALLAMFSVITIIIFILILFTLYGQSVRQTEINNALHTSMENAMEQLLLDEGRPETVEEWEAMFIESLVMQIDSQSGLTVHILEADMEKGILSVEAVLTFQHPIGTEGNVSALKTIILEEYVAE